MAVEETVIDEPKSRRERTMERLRERKELHKQRSRVYRISFAAIGITVILIGLVLVPLPGPGWLIVAIGVGMLALEFDRAERLLERLLEKLEDAAEVAGRWPRWLQAIAVAVGALASVAAVAAGFLWEIPVLPG